ncbi:unnamed protein product, partial [Ectocarpus sp. 12 AP-2014]
MYKNVRGSKNFKEFAVAIHKNLKSALAVLHRGERDVWVNLVRNVIKAIYKDNSNGRRNPALVASGAIVKTVRKQLRACPPEKKLEFSEAAMKETLSRVKFADRKGKPVSLTQVFHCTDSLHYDMVSISTSEPSSFYLSCAGVHFFVPISVLAA